MSSLIKSIFTPDNSNAKDQEISARLSKIQALTRELEKQKHQDISPKVKAILNTAFKDQKGLSLFQIVYISSMKQSFIQWVPIIQKTVNILAPNSPFMRIILQNQDLKITIEKQFIPNFLFKNNLLNQKNAYLNISYSINGMIVPLLDYVFIRLLSAIQQLHFIDPQKQFNEQYQTDDLYNYMCRNPYILLLRKYIEHFPVAQKNLKRLTNDIKMFFVDQIIIRYRINRSISQSRQMTFFSSHSKILPHHFIVLFLLLKKVRTHFQEKDLYFPEVIQRFSSLIEKQNEIYFRIFFRLFIFSFSKQSIEHQVIETLEKANQRQGFFQLQRYSTSSFGSNLKIGQKREKDEYTKNKTMILKLLQKDSNYISGSRIHFSTIRTIGCFLTLQIKMKQIPSSTSNRQNVEQAHRLDSQANCLQACIIKIHRFVNAFLKRLSDKKQLNFTAENKESLRKQLDQLDELYFQAYGRRIDRRKLNDLKDNGKNKNFNIRGQNDDFIYSVQTYKKDIEDNCWKAPLKDSQYQILYDLFRGIAQKADKMIPGHKNREYPLLPLRYFCNPFVFMLTMVLLLLIAKIMF